MAQLSQIKPFKSEDERGADMEAISVNTGCSVGFKKTMKSKTFYSPS